MTRIMLDTWKIALIKRCIQEGEPLIEELRELKLNELTALVVVDWKRMSPHAEPYVEALIQCESIQSMYGMEKTGHLIPYLLDNANHWTGPVARAVKEELRRRYGEWVKDGEKTTEE